MSVPDHELDEPGDPYCGVCGCCHAEEDDSYSCVAIKPAVEEENQDVKPSDQ